MIGQVYQQTPEWFSWCQKRSWEDANLWVMNMCSLNPKMVAIAHTTSAKSEFMLNWMNIWINIIDMNVVECLINDLCVWNLDCMVENGIMLILMRTSQPGWKDLSAPKVHLDLKW